VSTGDDVDVIEIDGASNRGIDEIRQLRQNAAVRPGRGRFKIYIIDEVHMLTSQAFNALLKTLEEPPPHVKFIFATTEPQKVLPTILSRCQRFDLHRIPANLIADHLQYIAKNEKVTLAPAAAHAIAKGADGGLRDAESMLDQLVAFCGEKIAEADVLSVFGFTSEQTVAAFTDRILRGATAEALELLQTEAANGKDMMKLMSDLIAYLRDVLVFKVKPEAVAEDFNPELRQALEEQAAVIETDRLLELIDQFAGAEGRMKWAPNKKLHFEVAVIKAIQTLGQVTLNEVIENLSALRDGKAAPAMQTAPKATERPTSNVQRSTSKSEQAVTAPVVKEGNESLDVNELWEKALGEIRKRRPLIKGWIDSAKPLGREGRTFLLGFPPEQKTAMESIAMPRNRDFLESVLKEISGRDWTLKFSLKEGLEVQPPKPEPRAETPSPRPRAETAAAFKDDPLIREALEIFKGEIKT